MKNTPAKEISVNHLPAKTVVPPDMAAPLPVVVPVEDVGEFLHRRGLRVVRCYWNARKEFVVEAEEINAHTLLRMEEQQQAGDALQTTVPGVGAGRDEQRAR